MSRKSMQCLGRFPSVDSTSDISNKLLVLVDGRSYMRLPFRRSMDQVDTPLEDIRPHRGNPRPWRERWERCRERRD